MTKTLEGVRREALDLLAQEVFGNGSYLACDTEERLFMDGLLERVEKTYTQHVPEERVHAEHAARVVAHRQAQARFSVAIPASLARAMQRAIEGVVTAHERNRLPVNQYTGEHGDMVVTLSALTTLPPSLLLPVGIGDPRD